MWIMQKFCVHVQISKRLMMRVKSRCVHFFPPLLHCSFWCLHKHWANSDICRFGTEFYLRILKGSKTFQGLCWTNIGWLWFNQRWSNHKPQIQIELSQSNAYTMPYTVLVMHIQTKTLWFLLCVSSNLHSVRWMDARMQETFIRMFIICIMVSQIRMQNVVNKLCFNGDCKYDWCCYWQLAINWWPSNGFVVCANCVCHCNKQYGLT